MKVNVASVFVDDQEKAHRFYTEKLGFVTVMDMPVGDARLIILGSPEDPSGAKLMLEPDAHPAAKAYKRAIYEDEIPATSFGVDDARKEHARLAKLGVKFTLEPTQTPWGVQAILDDTCGNLIQIHQDKKP